MFTLKIYDNDESIFNNVKDAIKYIQDTNFEKEISLYDINSEKAYNKTRKIYEVVKEYNKDKHLKDQILPSNPFGFRGILGCLGVQVYSISFGTYEKNHNRVALFTGYNSSVLDTSVENAQIVPSIKALTSLAILGSMIK